MSYDIRNYDESYLVDQVRIGKEVIDKYWRGLGQSPVDRLKMVYERSNFDPKSKFYAFREDEMVGFITSTIIDGENGEKTARMEFPLVLDQHKAAEKILIDTCLAYLKNMGVSKVYSRGGENWGDSLAHIQNYGFVYDSYYFSFGEFYPERIDSSILKSESGVRGEIMTFGELDEELVKSYYLDVQGFSEQFFKAVKARYLLNTPNTRSWSFVVVNNEIVTSSRMFVGIYGKNDLEIEGVRVGFDRMEYTRKIINYQLMEALHLNMSKLRLYIEDDEFVDLYQSYGVVFNKINMYVLHLH